MKIKSIFVVVIVALIAATAQATTSVPTLTKDLTVGLGDNYLSGSADTNIVVNVVKGSFADVFNFTLPVSNVDGSFWTANFTTGPKKAPTVVGISDVGFSYTLQKGTAVVGSGNAFDGFSFSNLAAGKYSLTLAGKTTGSSGQFNGDVFVAAVPEPGEWAMMLAGLGLLGVIARRRTRV